MTIIRIVVVLLVGIVLVSTWMVLSGNVDVAARRSQGGALDWLLDLTRAHSVKAHAARAVHGDFARASVPLGAAHYREMCVVCHGGPGLPVSEIGVGLNPSPPNLVESVRELSAGEIYWVMKNGVRMTGMPAFGVTHDEEALDAMTAFVLRLPGMSAEEFKALADSGEPAGGTE